MSIRQTLIDAGYKVAGVKMSDESLNRVSNILSGHELTKRNVTAAFQYISIEDIKPSVLGAKTFDPTDYSYYSSHFWKIYPEV